MIHPDSRKYLRFAFENKVYQFQVLPFGLNTAPQVFTRLGHTVAAYLHCQGILVILYLDDWLIHHPDCQVLLRHQSQLLNILNMVGLRSNEAKSALEPVQDIHFLGLQLHLDQNFPPSIQSSGDNGTHVPNILPEILVVHGGIPVYGITQLGLRSHPSGSSTLEAPTMTLSLFRSDKPVFTTAAFRASSPCHPTPAMAGPVVSHIRNPYPTFPGRFHHFHGRLDPGGAHMGDSQIAGVWTLFSMLKLRAVILALHHWVTVLQGHYTNNALTQGEAEGGHSPRGLVILPCHSIVRALFVLLS